MRRMFEGNQSCMEPILHVDKWERERERERERAKLHKKVDYRWIHCMKYMNDRIDRS